MGWRNPTPASVDSENAQAFISVLPSPVAIYLRRMDVDPLEAAEPGDNGHSRLNTRVAITVALLATFMGLCKVKDDNIVQAMQQAQANKIDDWSFYQARNIRQEVAQSTVTALQLQRRSASASDRAAVDSALARYTALVRDQTQKKDSLRLAAAADQAAYDSLNYRDDQFDLSDA